MAFKPNQSDIVSTMPLVELPATAEEAYTVGEALKLSGGAVTKCGATDTPLYICGQELTAAAGDSVRCWRVPGTMTFETTLAAAGTALKIGDKVTLHTDGAQVTATTASGVAEIVRMDGTAAGSPVTVRF